MSIELCKTDKQTSESQFTPICTAEVFASRVLPIARRLHLEMVECLPGLTITDRYKKQFLDELVKCRDQLLAVESSGHTSLLQDSLENLIDEVRRTSLDEFDLSTG
jgi:hypothetical protein